MKTITININDKDYNKLNKYGFDFEKNITEYLHDVAEQIRTSEKARKVVKKDPFKSVVSVYTGGGIWLFYGELKSGEFFLTDDNGCTLILDASPENFDESLYEDWQEEHFVRVVGTRAEELAFLHSLLDRLQRRQDKGPKGAYIDDYEIANYREDWDATWKANWGVEL